MAKSVRSTINYTQSGIATNACIGRCAYPVLNGDESSIFCVSPQVALSLAATFLRHNKPNLSEDNTEDGLVRHS